jgi:anthranilate/para-aminobenzoate synthase component I
MPPTRISRPQNAFARNGSVREVTVGWADPERVHLSLFAEAPASIWLDGGPDAASGMSVMGIPSQVVTVDDPDDALPTLRELLAAAPRVGPRATPTPLGWAGWLGYEVGAAEQRAPAHVARTPAMVLGYLDRAIIFDHAERRIRLLAREGAAAAEAWFDDTAHELASISSDPIAHPPHAPLGTGPVRWRHDRGGYLELIEETQRLIAEGEVYQVCLCNEAVVEGVFDPTELHRRLRRRSPSHHGGLFRAGGLALVCGSPEQFLSVDVTGHAVTRPMKGTRRRGDDPEADRELARELGENDKELAENVMIVDLMRNDLSRVSEVGSVEVTELFGVEQYATVHQLVSTVESSLVAGLSPADLLAATLPPGSMTGAPKYSAMTTIDRLEAGPRGVFSGVFGRFSLDGTVDLAVVIRSIVVTPTAATFGAGGGITALSVAEEEYAETMLKAQSMLWALGVRPDEASS